MANLEALKQISNEYYDLNGDYFETLQSPPSALEFSRLVHISRPVLIKGFQLPSQLGDLWSDSYLKRRMGNQKISVAVTPNGRADAVTLHSGQLYFAEPFVDSMTMEYLLDKLSPDSGVQSSEIHYLQSQNGNLYTTGHHFDSSGQDLSEFGSLKRDVPSEITWCSEALGRTSDAVNLWIGDARSVTSIHSDPYENIYCVVRGTKHFTLFPPTDSWCMNERVYRRAAYSRSSASGELTLSPFSKDTPPVRWSSIWDPDTCHPGGSHPIQITVEAGDTLYLPAGWWHHVRQSRQTTIALNWWYDMEMSGTSWVILSYLRGLSLDEGHQLSNEDQEI